MAIAAQRVPSTGPLSAPVPEAELPSPRIVPNRRRLDNRFPVLAFSIQTGGRPYFEVLLTTDRALFDPAAAARRTPANFYASRQDGGLSTAGGPEAVYLVPAAVLRTFAQAAPRPAELYYTVAAYTAPDSDPALPFEPAALRDGAPSVALAGDFTGHTLATVLGVSDGKLVRYTGRAAVAPAPVAVMPEPAEDPSPEEDAREGEDGYAFVDAEPTRLAVGYADGFEDEHGVVEDDGLAVWQEAALREPAPLADDAAADQGDEMDGYDPGVYGTLDAGEAEPAPAAPQPLTVEVKRGIIEHIAHAESGAQRYQAMNADGEFRGRFGREHPAYGRYHVGLSYGIVQFTQDSSLGQLLLMMRDRDPGAFETIFGPDADELIRVTTAAGPPSRECPGGRSARVQPVAGYDLWDPEGPWPKRFREAGDHPPFQAAQNELAATAYLEPMLEFARSLGLTTERALTMVVDRAVQMGVAGARQWIIAAVGPIATPALRQQALAALGHADLRDFQAASPGVEADGMWGPLSHAALVAALRELGAAAPIPIPTSEQMLDALVRAAATERWAERVSRLRTAADLGDVPFAL